MTGVIAFTIPGKAGDMLPWFMAALRPLAGLRYREGGGADVVLEEPRAERPREPNVFADVVLPATRIRATRVPSERLPEPCFERFDLATEPREPVMRFRLAAVGGETYVLASCDERLAPLWEKFLDVLRLVEACFPEVGPFWQPYEAERLARVREDLKARFGGAAAQADPPPAAEPPPEEAHAGETLPPVPVPERRRGRKATDPAEINKICADWLNKYQYRETQTSFCNRRGISPSLLRSWLKHYPYPES